MWVDPVFRQKTVDWTKTSIARLHAYATAQDMKRPQGGTSPQSASDAANGIKDIPISSAAPREPAGDPKAKAPIEETKPVAEQAAPSAKAPEPPPAPSPAKPVIPKPAPAAPSVAALPPEATPAKAPTPQEEAIPDTFEGQVTREKQLFKSGLQAEFGRPPNYDAALKAYSDIKKLPKEVWPSNLDARISDVKRKMK
jgi:hypothetical protein